MKVLWLSQFLPYPPRGGALQRSHNLLLQAARRHEVHLVALSQPRAFVSTSERDAAVTALEGLVDSLTWFPIPSESSRLRWAALAAGAYFRKRSYSEAWFRNPDMARSVTDLISEWKPDVIHVDTIGLTQYLKGDDSIPFVLTHHNVESHLWGRRASKESNPLKRAYLRREARKLERLEKHWVPRAGVNLSVSELDAQRLAQRAPGGRHKVVKNGVDLAFFKPGDAEDRRGLVFSGTYSWYPNQAAVRYFLDDIWPALVADEPDRTVTFVGKDPFPGLTEAAAADSRIRVTGYVDDVRPYLDEAAIYVCPIQDGGGTRLKILDALAMEKPLVATALAVEGLGLEEGHHFLRAETPEEFVRQVRVLEEDEDARRRLGAAGRRIVEAHYGWDQIGDQLDRAYSTAARSGGGGA